MKFHATPIKGLWVIELEPFADHRGRFSRLFCKKELAEIGLQAEIVQVNHSVTVNKGALRGLHFQNPPYGEDKIIRCLRGEVFDVAVDLRQGSETFLQWFGQRLSPENNRAMFLPKGFAHGFQTLQPESELIYFHTQFYAPEYEGGFRYNDESIGVNWPEAVTEISDKDLALPTVSSDFKGI
ncbi:dTDP-4-dehydrorhamnose 3,5-epimerase [Desulfatibacillum alkenivorans DSM 16219]|jgi:dTDP-4-dehydrorhamnose 3,5-epimerase|uniref:dTDP-4-dehydrorhamnose 3,5-epimerase n=1 Tax=Desulfatibacillum alkenivorans DSM 16219 TaxID=1121393 RepID=A0A1M6RX72_9BACT|nr:dTDP-4-dehydrorhamnose 3,5-epimerase [Desulfatibacillum alkenivorans]SHK36918.1 dTDP-4-dehydrorhamnose 3,5-epimerase [Desulfatibacillum alkenivorans DSM 16219]